MPPLNYQQAFAKLDAAMDARLDELTKINVSMNSRLLARKSALDRATEGARDRLAGATARQDLLARQQNPAGNAPQSGRALQDAVEGLREQERILARIRVSMDPDIQRENLKLTEQITEAEKERELSRLRAGMDAGGLEKQLRLEREIADVHRERDLAKAKLDLDPANVKKDVSYSREMADIKKRRADLTATEEGRQSPWKTLGKAAGDIGGKLPGGGAIGTVGDIVGQATGGGAKAISGAMQGLGVGAAAAGPIGAIAAALPMVIDTVVETLGKLKDTIVSLGSAASVGAAMRWDMVQKDLTATIGRALVPALEILSKGFRLFADVVNTILPSSTELAKAFAPVEEYLATLRDELNKIGPELRQLGRIALRELAAGISMVYGAIKPIIPLFRMLFQNSLLGRYLASQVDPNEKKELNSSVGNAPRDARFMDVEGYVKEQYASILTQSNEGGNKKEDPNEKTAKNSDLMVKHLVDLVVFMEQLIGNTDPEKLATKIGVGIAKAWWKK